MKTRVRIKGTTTVGTLLPINENFDELAIGLPSGKIIFKEASELIIITFFEWVLAKVSSWIDNHMS